MEVVFKQEQFKLVSKKVNLPFTKVSEVLNSYIQYLKDEITNGNTVRFLNICYIKVDGNGCKNLKTRAFIATELSKEVDVSSSVIMGILDRYEELIEKDVTSFFPYTIKGLLRIKIDDSPKGNKLHIYKTSEYNNLPIRIYTIRQFKYRCEDAIAKSQLEVATL